LVISVIPVDDKWSFRWEWKWLLQQLDKKGKSLVLIRELV
jgi:hypothetical protein